ncbi:MAG: DUF4114 domain-containing protein [Leptolyngbyaceae cyanobacterium CSU_1_3]|nr:DUF4114 domain-containing protein [Leptolyngbyaceae cyanobacterium CSU_1_3]
MNNKFFAGLLAATAAITGVISQASSATAAALSPSDAVWDSVQPTVLNKAQTGFNDAPFQPFVQAEGIVLAKSKQFKLDPTKLKLKYDYNVSAFFINEGAGYRNQLAFTSKGATNTSALLFKDISCEGTGCVGGWGGNALKMGDGVSMGQILGGSQLDFSLRADGLNRGAGANVFGTQTAMNEDGLQHVVAYAVNNRYLLLGFEDLYGQKNASDGKNENSDRDFNDTVFAIDIGEDNIRALKVPEPSVGLSLLGLGAAGIVLRRRRQSSIVK